MEKNGNKPGSRAAMMQRAKDLGIKYFRILSKSELPEILAYGNEPSKADTEKINKIIEAAKRRWQNCPFFQKKAKKA